MSKLWWRVETSVGWVNVESDGYRLWLLDDDGKQLDILFEWKHFDGDPKIPEEIITKALNALQEKYTRPNPTQ